MVPLLFDFFVRDMIARERNKHVQSHSQSHKRAEGLIKECGNLKSTSGSDYMITYNHVVLLYSPDVLLTLPQIREQNEARRHAC